MLSFVSAEELQATGQKHYRQKQYKAALECFSLVSAIGDLSPTELTVYSGPSSELTKASSPFLTTVLQLSLNLVTCGKPCVMLVG